MKIYLKKIRSKNQDRIKVFRRAKYGNVGVALPVAYHANFS